MSVNLPAGGVSYGSSTAWLAVSNIQQFAQRSMERSTDAFAQAGPFRATSDNIDTMPTATKLLKLIPCALIFFMSHALCAGDANKTVVSDIVKHWQVLKSLSLEVAQAIPENEYTSKPAFTEQDPSKIGPFEMNALALETVLACSVGLGIDAPARFQSAFDRPMDSTKTGTIMNLTVAFDFCIDGLNQINDTDLFKASLRGFKGHPAIKFDIVWDAYTHAAHRLGKTEMYLRLKGITPPDTGPKFSGASQTTSTVCRQTVKVGS
jgi:hypothetical protein